jgi:molybdate transport repressor ModE-like protein
LAKIHHLTMHKVSIKPQWTIRRNDGASLSTRLIEVLVDVHEHGSLSRACQHSGASYRHAWDLVRQGEALFGSPLMVMARGKGSQLTPLGEKLVWADRRISARLTPALETLASELETEIEQILGPVSGQLRMHASHGFAVEKLCEQLAQVATPVELKYCNSQQALAGLHEGACDVAGFHVPLGEYEAHVVAHYGRWFDVRLHTLIHVATRRQGLMVARGNPRKIYDVRDLTRLGVRFINRLPGSGTRLLLDLMLQSAHIDPAQVNGYEQGEYTHAAVAAYVASGMADAGFGVETPARKFNLDFIPLHSERYFLLCQTATLDTPQVRSMLAALRSAEFAGAVNALPGYEALRAGEAEPLTNTFASLVDGSASVRQPVARRQKTRS